VIMVLFTPKSHDRFLFYLSGCAAFYRAWRDPTG